MELIGKLFLCWKCKLFSFWIPQGSFCSKSACCKTGKQNDIQLFRERLSEKMCTPQSRKVIWDMINIEFLTLQLSNLLFLLSFSTRRHISMAPLAILSNFFEEQWTKNHPQYLSGLSRALFPTTFLEKAVCHQKFSTPAVFTTYFAKVSKVTLL